MTAIPHVHGAPILKVSSGEPQRSLSLVPDNATSGDSGSPHCSKGTTLMDMSSTMTHYMELLASNQPWNLLIFMAIPVIFAEFIAVTELSILFQRNLGGTIKRLNSYAGLFVGFYFVGVFVYLLTPSSRSRRRAPGGARPMSSRSASTCSAWCRCSAWRCWSSRWSGAVPTPRRA